MQKEQSAKERCAELGGLLSCSYRTRDGRERANMVVRAHDAKEARRKIRGLLGVALAAFTVNWYLG